MWLQGPCSNRTDLEWKESSKTFFLTSHAVLMVIKPSFPTWKAHVREVSLVMISNFNILWFHLCNVHADSTYLVVRYSCYYYSLEAQRVSKAEIVLTLFLQLVNDPVNSRLTDKATLASNNSGIHFGGLPRICAIHGMCFTQLPCWGWIETYVWCFKLC